ncbi:InlB B-repeat-containing protein [Paludibaculum fermentans]|uniref:Fibronectin type-III domain-containing protein n=1 Tax=Paludibaculum fermentans TaxID=1473598 RepID=A0A7S7NVD9_PALFE|nr:hypothetical protein [Paludibaculum fermentans]QOY90515.1 hypothetical protein IRI77_11360 [Paludibaculum fermentans]
MRQLRLFLYLVVAAACAQTISVTGNTNSSTQQTLVSVPLEDILERSNVRPVPAIVANGISYAVGEVAGVPFATAIRPGVTEAFGIANGTLAFSEAGQLLLSKTGHRGVVKVAAEGKVLRAAWRPGSRSLAAIFLNQSGAYLALYDTAAQSLTKVPAAGLTTDVLTWEERGNVLYFVCRTEAGYSLVQWSPGSGETKESPISARDVPFVSAWTADELREGNGFTRLREQTAFTQAFQDTAGAGSAFYLKAGPEATPVADALPVLLLDRHLLVAQIVEGRRQYWFLPTDLAAGSVAGPQDPLIYAPLPTDAYPAGESALDLPAPSSCKAAVVNRSTVASLFQTVDWYRTSCGLKANEREIPPPVLRGPGATTSSGTEIAGDPILEWEPVPDAVEYELYVTRYKVAPSVGEEVYATNVYENRKISGSNTTWLLPGGVLERGGNYRWNVRAKFAAGATGHFSSQSLSFFVRGKAPAPVAPGKAGITEPIKVLAPVLTWLETKDSATYEIEVENTRNVGENSRSPVYQGSADDIFLRLSDGILRNNQTYSWRVRGVSSDGIMSEQAPPLEFAVGDGTSFAMELAPTSQTWNVNAGHYWNSATRRLWISNRYNSTCWQTYIVAYTGGVQAGELGFIDPYIEITPTPSGWPVGVASGSTNGPATCTTNTSTAPIDEMDSFHAAYAGIVSAPISATTGLTSVTLNLMDDDVWPNGDDLMNSVSLSIGADVTGPSLPSLTNVSATASAILFSASSTDANSGLYGYEVKLTTNGQDYYCVNGASPLKSIWGCYLFPSGTPLSVSGLAPGTSYSLTITGYDNVGNPGSTSVLNQTTKQSVTIRTSPSGLSYTVDGQAYSSTQVFSWTPGSPHSISTTTPQSGGTGIRYVWSGWNDGGGISHSVSAPNSATTYTASFTTQYYLTTSAGGGGGTVSPASQWYDAGQNAGISASAYQGYQFVSWSGTGSGSYSGSNASTNVTMNGPISETASFSQQVSMTVTTNPSGRSFTVDGQTYFAAQAFNWSPGSQHSIGTTTPQSGGTGIQYVWSNWNDGGAISHAVTAPGSATTYTANFTYPVLSDNIRRQRRRHSESGESGPSVTTSECS